MKKNRKIIFILILFTILSFNFLKAFENDFVTINNVISSNELSFNYDSVLGKIELKKNTKSIVLLMDSTYILIDNREYFTNNFIYIENGQVFITKELENIINNYFSGKDIFQKEVTIITKNENKDDFYLDLKRDNLNNTDNKNKGIKIDLTDDNIINNENSDEKINVKDKYIFVEKEPMNIKINSIIIDPGHGGEDPGAIGHSGTKEKDIVLKTSLILYDRLKKIFPDKKIVLTRYNDVFISLDKRANIANYVFNKYGTSLFVSIHTNASRSDNSYGFETWYLVEEYRRNIIKKGEISQDVDVESILNSMLNDEIYKESQDLAKKIQNYLEKEIGDVSKDRGIKEQTYFVIKKSIMPAVLVEIGFNTNKYEEIRLTKYSYLNKITNGILSGISEFIKGYEKTNGYTK